MSDSYAAVAERHANIPQDGFAGLGPSGPLSLPLRDLPRAARELPDLSTRIDETLAALGGTVTMITAYTEQLRRDVVAARMRGASWDQIATELGITKQAAYKRYAGSMS